MRAVRPVVIVLALVATVAGCSEDGTGVGDAPQRKATWESPVTGLGATRQASVVGDTVVVMGERGVVALGRADGGLRWNLPLDKHVDVRVTRTSVVVYDKAQFTVYDARTGRRGFTHKSTDRGMTTVSTSAVFVHGCAAKACAVTAYELPAGTVRWRHSYPRPAGDKRPEPELAIPGDSGIRHAEPKQRVEPLVALPADVVEFSTNALSESVLNAATGKPLGTFRIETIWTRVLDGRTGVYWDDSGSCDVALTGFAVGTGKQTWSRPAGRWGDAAGGLEVRCDSGSWTPAIEGSTAAITTPDQRPELIELDTGKVRWTGEAGVHVLDLTPTTVLARDGNGRGALVGLDTADGQQRWRFELPDKSAVPHVDRPALIGSRLTFSLSDSEGDHREVLQVRNAQTGEIQWAAEGSNWTLGVGQDWIVTGADGIEDDEGAKIIRLFAG